MNRNLCLCPSALISNFPADRFINLASQVHTPPAVNQVEANVFNQESEMF